MSGEKETVSKKCLIISGGEKSSIPDIADFAYIIACDRGHLYASSSGIRPNVIIGDFDSSDLPVTDIEIIKRPVMKDDTDTMLAVRHALGKGYLDITICCALGKRLDHAFANIQTGAFICENGGCCSIISDDTRMLFFKNASVALPRLEGWSLSVFSISDVSEGVSISGCKFNTDNVSFRNSFPIGVSNVWIDDYAAIGCRSGTLVIISSKLSDGEHI